MHESELNSSHSISEVLFTFIRNFILMIFCLSQLKNWMKSPFDARHRFEGRHIISFIHSLYSCKYIKWNFVRAFHSRSWIFIKFLGCAWLMHKRFFYYKTQIDWNHEIFKQSNSLIQLFQRNSLKMAKVGLFFFGSLLPHHWTKQWRTNVRPYIQLAQHIIIMKGGILTYNSSPLFKYTRPKFPAFHPSEFLWFWFFIFYFFYRLFIIQYVLPETMI